MRITNTVVGAAMIKIRERTMEIKFILGGGSFTNGLMGRIICDVVTAYDIA